MAIQINICDVPEKVRDELAFRAAMQRKSMQEYLRAELERAKLITTPEAKAAQDDLVQLEMELFSFEPFAERIWELRHTMTSFDEWYVALAEALKLPLATLDVPLSRSNKNICEFLTPRP